MTVSDGLKYLFDHVGCRLLIEPLGLYDFFEQFHAIAEFSYQVHTAHIFVDFVELKDIRMVEVLQDVDFIFQPDTFLVDECHFIDHFYDI